MVLNNVVNATLHAIFIYGAGMGIGYLKNLALCLVSCLNFIHSYTALCTFKLAGSMYIFPSRMIITYANFWKYTLLLLLCSITYV